MELPQDFVNEVEARIRINMLEDAAEECLRRIERQPNDSELLAYSVGVVSMGTSEQIKRLLEAIKGHLRIHPEDFRVRESQAVLLSLEKRYTESLAEFSKVPVEKLRPDAYWMWFVTLIHSGATTEVRQWIETVWPAYSITVRSTQFDTYLKFLWDVSAFLTADEKYEEAEAGYRFLL